MSNSRVSLHRWRAGFTLIELVVATAILAVIMVSLGSVIVAASKAMPAATSASDTTSSGADAAVDGMLSEARFATSIPEATPTAITFTIPDRNGDGNPETVRYAWAGAGSPLTRSYNGGTAAPVVSSVSSFALSFLKHKHTTSSVSSVTVDSGETQFSGFSAWAGITATASSGNLTTAGWYSELFVIDRISIPSDATRVAITRVSLKLKKPSSGTAGCTVGIYAPSATGSSTPASTPIGTPYSVPASVLTTSYAWVDATFSDCVLSGPSQTSLIIVVKGVASTTSASLQYFNSLLAPLDNSVLRWTTTSGGSWLPTSSLNANDALFAVYGSYQRQVTSNVNTDTYNLGSIAVTLQPAATAAPRTDSAVAVMNEPSMTGP